MFNFISNIESCYQFINANSTFLNLVYYSHLPTIVISLVIGIFVSIKNKTLLGKILFTITSLFSLWVSVDLLVWLSLNSMHTVMAWSLFWITSGLLSIFSFFFYYVYIKKADLSIKSKFILFSPILPLILLTPTKLAVLYYDLVNCEAKDGLILQIYYFALGALSILGILYLLIANWKKVAKEDKKATLLMAAGLEFFLVSFYSLSAISSYFDNYSIEFYGLFGMVIFMSVLAYLIVKFKTFDIKLLGAQALVWALVIIIGSEFFFIQSNVNKILTAITLVISAIVGLIIVRGVKKEIAQKEHIEKLAESLEFSNRNMEKANLSLEAANEKLKELDQMKSEFVSLATHQIRGPLAAIKGYISLMIEGDYGKIPKTFDEPLQTVFKSTDSLSKMVTDFLDVSRIDLGQMKYDFTEFDFRDLVNEVTNELKPNVDAKGLEFRTKITDKICQIKADRTKLKQVLNNLVDNSAKYTKQGWLEVSVENRGDKVLFAVKDSGVGISAKTIALLFQRFSRAKDANETNILGTGLGLYIAKKMVEANQGRIWVESEGEGKGAQFYVELPVIK